MQAQMWPKSSIFPKNLAAILRKSEKSSCQAESADAHFLEMRIVQKTGAVFCTMR
jgi:hypothetical protein